VTKENDSTLVLFSFENRNDVRLWRVINDNVMGGLSKGDISVTEDSCLKFYGAISLENNGGFSSVRSQTKDFNLAGTAGLIFRVKGDGKRYKAYLRMDSSFDGIIYQTAFETVSGKWIDVRRSFSTFEPTYHGRSMPDAGPLDTNEIKSHCCPR